MRVQLTCYTCESEIVFANGGWTHTEGTVGCPLLIVDWPDPPLFDTEEEEAAA